MLRSPIECYGCVLWRQVHNLNGQPGWQRQQELLVFPLPALLAASEREEPIVCTLFSEQTIAFEPWVL